ncbi:MAG TPA: PaaI family thioesterase [Polyangiales bacterium]|nr:PaaI family thioesterase [Polyangiales bacterium]
MSGRDPEKLKSKLLEFAKDFPFFNLVGFEVLDCGPGFSKCQIRLRPELHNPNGVLHGGILATLIDAGITQAMLMTDEYSVIRETKGAMSTVDLHIKYLRPISSGLAICESRVVHMGKRIVHAESKVKSEEGKDLALGNASMMLVAGKG